MNMQIWAGSGSSFNGKETVRRRSMTPQKTAKTVKRRKSSARIGLGLDGLCSDDIGESSSISSSSLKKDSAVHSDGFLNIIHPYDVEGGMVKPLSFGPADDDLKNVDTVGGVEYGFEKEKERKRRMGQDYSDSYENFPMPKKSKGEDINTSGSEDDLKNSSENVLKEIENTIQRLEDDLKNSQNLGMGENSHDMIVEAFSTLEKLKEEADALVDCEGLLSLIALDCGMASEDMNPRVSYPRVDQEKNLSTPGSKQRRFQSPESNSDGGASLANSPLGTKQESSKDLPPLNTTGLTQNDRQYLALIGSENERETLFGEEVSEIERPDELLHVDVATKSPRMIHLVGRDDMGSSGSESELERVFVVNKEQGLENESPDEDPRDEVVIFDIKSIRDSRIRNTLGKQTCMASICIPDPSTKTPSLVLEAGGSPSISPLLLCRSDSPSSDIEAIEDLTSFKEEICESGLEQHVPDEIQSGPMRDSTEVSSNCWADMKDRLDIASLEGISSNCGSTMSLFVTGSGVYPVMDNDDQVSSCSNVNIDVSAEASEEVDESFPYIQRENTSPEHRLSQSEPEISHVENYEAPLGWKENADSSEGENEREIASSEGFSTVHQLVDLYKTEEDYVCGVREMDDSIPFATGCTDISDPEKSVDLGKSENEREIESSEGFSPVRQEVISFMTPKRSIGFASRDIDIDGEVATNCRASIISSIRADYVDILDGDEREEKLIGGGCSGEERGISFVQVEDFRVKASGEKQASATQIEDAGEIEIDEEEQRYCLEVGRRMKRKNPGLLGPTIDVDGKVVMEISNAGLDNGVSTTRCSIPQMDGPGSPPLLTIDSPVERTWSPSPRKKLQKVNRSKSPTSMKQSSSSSLGKIFQSSRVEGLEGEIRDLRVQVGELKRVVDGLEKEVKKVKEVRVKGGKDCKVLESMGEKMKDVWRTLYGKGWEGERVGEEGQDWKDVDEVEYTREVRDLGLLRVVGRLKMEVDEQREEMGEDEDGVTLGERGIEKYEMDLMLPHPTEFDFNGRDNGNGKSKWNGKQGLGMHIPISSEYHESGQLGIGGGLKAGDLIVKKHLESVALTVSDSINLEEKLPEVEEDELELQSESRTIGDDGERLEVENIGTNFERQIELGHQDEAKNSKGDEKFEYIHEASTIPVGICPKIQEASDDAEGEDWAEDQHIIEDEQRLVDSRDLLLAPQDVIYGLDKLGFFGTEGKYSPALRMRVWEMIMRGLSKEDRGKIGWRDEWEDEKAVFGELVGKGDDERELDRFDEGLGEVYRQGGKFGCGDEDREIRSREEMFEDFLGGAEGEGKGKGKGRDARHDEEQDPVMKRIEDDTLLKEIHEFTRKRSDGKIRSWRPDEKEMRELIEARGIHLSDLYLGERGKREKKKREREKEEEKRVEYLMRCMLEKQEVERVRMEQWWEIERARDLGEIRRLGGEVKELKGLLLKGLEGGKASSVANMRVRDICGDEDGDEGGNGKGFWDWVGGGILWRQD
ncbi:hypothetical protein EYC80_007684 [Monilinia laxa]|uniref:Uncharacterized protein n=1 Tax=Monilinia laxa TaxID=61186 RepID=A0A5N6JWN7_MONLA|nr:hypothetical protein EYC80_007684 [Monilinia laxa]